MSVECNKKHVCDVVECLHKVRHAPDSHECPAWEPVRNCPYKDELPEFAEQAKCKR